MTSSVADLKAAAEHKVYWCGERPDEFVLIASEVLPTGVITLDYLVSDWPGKSTDWTEAVQVEIYEFDPALLDEGLRSGILGGLTDPRVVEGKAGTYTLYDPTPMGRPMLQVIKDSVHIHIFKPIGGDIELMVHVADLLEEVR